MTHLGTQLSALADGRLDAVARERALCHVAACRPCAEELAATRAARRALASAGDVPLAPDLPARLLALGATVAGDTRSASPRIAPVPSGPGPFLGLTPPPWQPKPLGHPGGRLSVRSAVAIGAGLLVMGLFALGDGPRVVPDSHPATDLALLAAAPTTATTLSVEAPPAAVEDAWLEALPAGFVLVGSVTGPGRVEYDLDGPAGPVVVVHEAGRLSDAVLRAVEPTVVGDRELYVLSDSPWHVVWQSGDEVVGVVAAHRAAGEAVVAVHPGRPFDDGVGARISRGWQTVVGAWAP